MDVNHTDECDQKASRLNDTDRLHMNKQTTQKSPRSHVIRPRRFRAITIKRRNAVILLNTGPGMFLPSLRVVWQGTRSSYINPSLIRLLIPINATQIHTHSHTQPTLTHTPNSSTNMSGRGKGGKGLGKGGAKRHRKVLRDNIQ